MRRIELGDFLIISEIHSGMDADQLARIPRVISLGEAALAAPFSGESSSIATGRALRIPRTGWMAPRRRSKTWRRTCSASKSSLPGYSPASLPGWREPTVGVEPSRADRL